MVTLRAQKLVCAHHLRNIFHVPDTPLVQQNSSTFSVSIILPVLYTHMHPRTIDAL
jgi:hypothetical protein